MAAGEPFVFVKPKKRFQVKQLGDDYVLVDERGEYWSDGQQIYRAYGGYSERPVYLKYSEGDAWASLPSPLEYDILPSDTPLVSVGFSFGSAEPSQWFITLGDEAVRIQAEAEQVATIITVNGIDGARTVVDMRGVKQVKFRVIGGAQ